MINSLIPISRPYISRREEEYVVKAVRSGWVSSLGEYIERFETAFAAYCGVEYALTTSNGTTGLHLALVSLEIGAGDEVIVPDLSFIATANAVAYTGAKPVLVDIDPRTNCISVDAIKASITPRTKAIIPVHLYGYPADMDPINSLAAEYELEVIEDAAEAHGAKYKGKRVGGLGRCGVFSFYGNKIITTGEGGMMTTNDRVLYERAKLLRDHAMSAERTYWHEEIGYNYRMTNLQAALGLAQLEQIEQFLAKRSDILGWYHQVIETSNEVRLNPVTQEAVGVNWMTCLEVDHFDEDSRAEFIADLKQCGIDTRPYFCAMSAMPMFDAKYNPVARRKAEIGLNLPTFIDLSQSEVFRIGTQVNSLLRDMGITL